jgi:serine/threonine-protein kinase
MLAGRYRLGDALGHGGGATVHDGYDSVLTRPVAVKIFEAGDAAIDVLREARTAAGLSHPNIAQVYDYGEVGDGERRTPYLVMESLIGETLADRLAGSGVLRRHEAAEVCADVAAALAVAHAQGLVHGDVTTRNVMITPDGVKVLGFELATAAGPDGAGTDADLDALGRLLVDCSTRPGEQLPRGLTHLYEACVTETAASAAETLRRAARPARTPRPARSRRRVAVMAAAAVVAGVLSIVGLQVANGGATPGGHPAEAAVEPPHPATTTPPAGPAPSTSPATPVHPPAVTSAGRIRKKTPARRTASATPTPSAPSSSAPASTPPSGQPTPSKTPESPAPTEPTTPTTSPTPDDTPPVTTSPGTSRIIALP